MQLAIQVELWMAHLLTKYWHKYIYISKVLQILMMKIQKQKWLLFEVLPKKLDEEVAALMVEGFGGVITKLTQDQADYINVPQEGPFKEESYKY